MGKKNQPKFYANKKANQNGSKAGGGWEVCGNPIPPKQKSR